MFQPPIYFPQLSLRVYRQFDHDSIGRKCQDELATPGDGLGVPQAPVASVSSVWVRRRGNVGVRGTRGVVPKIGVASDSGTARCVASRRGPVEQKPADLDRGESPTIAWARRPTAHD